MRLIDIANFNLPVYSENDCPALHALLLQIRELAQQYKLMEYREKHRR